MKKKNTVLLLFLAILLLASQFAFAAGQQDAEEGGEKTLVVWSHVTSHLIEFINELIPQFEADNPGVKIEYSAIEFAGYSTQEFWQIVDSFYNQDLFEKNDIGEWELKNPLWKK